MHGKWVENVYDERSELFNAFAREGRTCLHESGTLSNGTFKQDGALITLLYR